MCVCVCVCVCARVCVWMGVCMCVCLYKIRDNQFYTPSPNPKFPPLLHSPSPYSPGQISTLHSLHCTQCTHTNTGLRNASDPRKIVPSSCLTRDGFSGGGRWRGGGIRFLGRFRSFLSYVKERAGNDPERVKNRPKMCVKEGGWGGG